MNWKAIHKTLFLCAAFALFSLTTFASGGEENKKEGEKFKPAEMIFHHVLDAYEWEFFSIGETHITLPLPVILYTDKGLDIFLSSEIHHHGKEGHYEKNGKHIHTINLVRGDIEYVMENHRFHHVKGGGMMLLDLSITKNVASLLISALLTMFIFISVAASYKKNAGKAPKGMQSFFEPIILFVRDDIAKTTIGERYERYLPYLLSLFFFIWFNNLMGLMPGGANLTGNIAVTFTLAALTFAITLFSAKKAFWGHIFMPPGVPAWLLPIMIPIELIGVISKPFSLMIRLFANISAGHIMILSLFSLTFIFQSYVVGIFSAAFATAMNLLELFVALLQAYVFTLLTSMYIGQAVEEHHHEEHEHEHAHAAHH
ncbi:MAG: ATP synthase F0 subunit A [Cytophagales bacterium]|nr:MAG: ATP synthase F0 subunit A [Cytophagales bacterium]